MSWWQLYLIFAMPGIATSGAFLLFVPLLGLGALLIVSFVAESAYERGRIQYPATYRHVTDDDIAEQRAYWRRMRRLTIPVMSLAFTVWFALVLVPSERAMMHIVGGYVATNIDGVEQLGPNFVDAANALLERYSERKR